MSLNQVYDLLVNSKTDKQIVLNDDDKRILKTYFNIDNRDPWTKYKDIFPNMYPCIINKLVMDDLLKNCKNRGERRQMLREIKAYNKLKK